MCKKVLKSKSIGMLFSILVIVVSGISTELSLSSTELHTLFSLNIKYIILNVLTLQVLYTILLIITDRLWISGIIFSVFTGVISLVNYYTIMYHGLPFSTMELHNITTALNVMHSYKIKPDFISSTIFLLTVGICILCVIEKGKEIHRARFSKEKIIRNIILVIISVSSMYFGYFSANPVKPAKIVGWSWQEAYCNYGYAACTVEIAAKSFNVIQKPDNYDEKIAEDILYGEQTDKDVLTELDNLPDIIVILNETFYDLSLGADIETDEDYLQEIHSMGNLVSGYAAAPSAGGGTNSSEYELLTSNSLEIMPNITPFNVLNMNGAESVVSYLNGLGYKTIAAHSEAGSNYSRNRAYAEMGFDQIHFLEDFEELEFYHDRYFAEDSSLYDNLIRWYEVQCEDAEPIFMYMLTIQNHGGWNLNDSVYDTVHVLNAEGEYTEEMNEYLTCIKNSDNAFKKLTEYFEKESRPVIIMMVGDHSPSFISDVCDPSKDNLRLLLCSTPFFIWSNWGMEAEDMGILGMTALMPQLLEKAGIPLSSYYQYIYELTEDVPVLTCYDVYYDKNEVMHYYTEDTEYKGLVDTYFSCEYENVKHQ